MSASRFQPGLVSISFRNLTPEAIIDLVAEAQLDAIEWGGDVHVPHGDVAAAELIAQRTREANLIMPTYGSYYRLGTDEAQGPRFEDVLASAEALGVQHIRVWAGSQGSAKTLVEQRKTIEDDLRRVCDLAGERSIGVALEYHVHTLTDDPDSCVALLREVDRPNLSTLWQTTNGRDVEYALGTLRKVRPWLSHLHVFHWGPGGSSDRRPLADGRDDWRQYLAEARDDAQPRCCLLEFFKDNSIEQFKQDAASLREWLLAMNA